MNQFRRFKVRPRRKKIERPAVRIGHLIVVLSILFMSGEIHAAPTLRIAVAPFAGDASTVSVAKALARQLGLRNLDRLIAPGDFVAVATFEPRAAEIRRWAHNTAVDTIVVGRVSSPDENSAAPERFVETVLRSGHSGGELSRHDVVVPRGGNVNEAIERLAVEILSGLGYIEPSPKESRAEVPVPAVSSAAAHASDASDTSDTGGGESQTGADAGSSSSGLEHELSRGRFRSDSPIEIKADEAEIITRDEGRKLIFQRNVWVRQANVILRCDHLEAIYQKGESEPRELMAQGRVHIVQDDRHANCDKAIYLRESNSLICRGRAELVQGCDVVRGESIEFDLASDKARVTGAASIVIQPEKSAPSDCAIDRGQM
jgi:lipopolysaccharide transport protein LptA